MFDFFEKGYYYEFERKVLISNGVNLPITILVSVLGAVLYCISEYFREPISYGLAFYAFLVFFIISLVLISVCIYYLVRAFWSLDYKILQDYDYLKEFHKKILEYYKHNDGNYFLAEDLANEYFNKYLERAYSEAATFNYNLNLKRSLFLHKGKIFLFLSIPILFVCMALLLISGIERENKVADTGISKYESFALIHEGEANGRWR